MLVSLAIITIIVVSLAVPASTLAAAQEVTQSTLEPTAAATLPEPTAIPTLVPTPTPVPTIAPTPTPVPPTPTPVPTDTPPPPTAAPTQEATVTPTGTSESPSPTASATATATPLATATVAPTVTPVPDTIVCNQLVGTRNGSIWQFDATCVYTVNSARSETRIQATMMATDAPGWTVQLRPTGGDWTAPGTAAELTDAHGEAGATINFDVLVIAPATATAGQRATISIASQMVGPAGATDGPEATLNVSMPNTVSRQTVGVTSIVAQTQPAVLSCTQPNGDTVMPGQTLTYQCQFSVEYQNPGKVVTTFNGMIPSGWDIGLTSSFGSDGSPASPMNGDGAAQIEVSSKGGSLSGTIAVSVKAPAAAAPGSTSSLTLASDCDKSQACPTSAQKGSVTITTTVAPVQCKTAGGDQVAASLSGGALPAVPFAYTARTNSGNMTLAVQNPTMCTGWNVDISATSLTYSGAAPGQPSIPASNLKVSGAGVSTVQLSSTSQRLVSNGGTNTAYTYPLTLTLTIPAGAPAGVYTSTLTVTTTASP